MLLGIIMIVIVSYLLGHHVGRANGYEEAFIDITNIGVCCNGQCNSCDDPCNLKDYVDYIKVEKMDE